MSRSHLINWGKWAAVATITAAVPVIAAWAMSGTRKAIEISDTPERQSKLEQRVSSLETNCTANFYEIKMQLREVLENQKQKRP